MSCREPIPLHLPTTALANIPPPDALGNGSNNNNRGSHVDGTVMTVEQVVQECCPERVLVMICHPDDPDDPDGDGWGPTKVCDATGVEEESGFSNLLLVNLTKKRCVFHADGFNFSGRAKLVGGGLTSVMPMQMQSDSVMGGKG